MARPVISLQVIDREQGNDARIMLSCQQVKQVVLMPEAHDFLQSWLVDVFNSEASSNRIEIHDNGMILSE